MSPSLQSLLVRLREASGLSIRQLEARSGVNRSIISRLERSEVLSPTPETLIRLAEALGADASELLMAAGYTATRAAALPSFRPYLRAKYGHLPPGAQAELAAYLERLEADYRPQASKTAAAEPAKRTGRTKKTT